jgi:hypothetical protein
VHRDTHRGAVGSGPPLEAQGDERARQSAEADETGSGPMSALELKGASTPPPAGVPSRPAVTTGPAAATARGSRMGRP